ncbi:hypothetical protein [Actinoallomurus sp. CA-150999]|uniref:oxidoreductase n=1 Tax=Actinoallomurus sp. CA-150999 TaxID=3239887 RepID=UPI003D8E78DF
MSSAFESYEPGGRRLANRIVMAPMTRSRAYDPGASPTDLMATYYAQRASAGLIITEGMQPSVVGQGYPDTPGLHSAQQVAAWRKVTDAVHAAGGVAFAQPMHTDRVGHPDLPARLAAGGPYNAPDHATSFGDDQPRLHRLPHPHLSRPVSRVWRCQHRHTSDTQPDN